MIGALPAPRVPRWEDQFVTAELSRWTGERLALPEQFPDISRIPPTYSQRRMGAFRIKLVGISLACLLAAGATAGVAHSLFTPAWSYVPAATRAQLAKQQGGSLFLPARTPLFYRYRNGAQVAGGVLSVSFTNRVRIRKGLWRWTGQSFVWQVRKLPAGKTCDQWANRTQTFQVDGNKVFGGAGPGGAVAWRCVTNAHGTYVLSASNGGKLPAVGLAIVVASGLDVSRRK
jgi:hypothetical protein